MQSHPEIGIRTTHTTLSQEVTDKLGVIQSDLKQQHWYRRLFNKRNRKRTIRYSLLAANFIVLVIAVVFVTRNATNTGQPVARNAIVSGQQETTNPLDQLSSADIAVNIARVAQLPEATSVTNLADTVNAQLTVTPADSIVVAKPQVIATGLKSRYDIQTYVAQEGDTISSVAEKFGVSSDTIRWSNGLTGDAIPAGKELVIAPIDGIVYAVKSEDTIDSITNKYHANKEQLIAFNDLETGSLPVGEWIVIPNGQLPATQYTRPVISGFAAVYGFNGYDYGYCTWWAATRRAQIGRPIPSNLGNASTWRALSQSAGLGVGNVPAAGAVIWTPPRDYYGHVGFVESVNPDGSVNISEMNTVGWGVVSHKTLSPEQAAGYSYIY